ncbi:MAG TPA: hypothetical protein VKE51_08640 [Vicinamibacterales bacterium]|nr:hypothetical protein [Vicinamibacterales bacterium]
MRLTPLGHPDPDGKRLTGKHRSWRGLGLSILTTAALAFPATSEATHFRYGHYTWVPTGATSVEFRLQNAFRRDGYLCVNPSTLTTVICTAPDGHPGIGDVFPEFIGNTRLDFGDGSGTVGSPLGPLMYLVTSVDTANNWLFALALDPSSLPARDTTISHTYPSAGQYIAFTDSCCRISSVDNGNAHINNPDGGYRVQTTVTVGSGNTAPVSALPPIVICPYPATCSFTIPAADADGDPTRFRLSTASESSSFRPGGTCPTTFCQPGSSESGAPNPATVSPSGMYTWDTTGALLGPAGTTTLYSTQVTIEDVDSTGTAKSAVALDFLIQLVPCPAGGCIPPTFPAPPVGVPPVCNATFPVSVGGLLTFRVDASDANAGDSVSLNAVGLPPGAVLTPALPTAGNPVATSFGWRPSLADVGTLVITFSASSQDGIALCPVTVQVSANTPPSARCEPGPNPSGHLPSNGAPANENGFYRLLAVDAEDGTAPLYVSNSAGTVVFGPFSSETVVKITEAPAAVPSISPIGGTGSAVMAHIILDSDAVIYAVDSGGLVSPQFLCRVPPPPK